MFHRLESPMVLVPHIVLLSWIPNRDGTRFFCLWLCCDVAGLGATCLNVYPPREKFSSNFDAFYDSVQCCKSWGARQLGENEIKIYPIGDKKKEKGKVNSECTIAAVLFNWLMSCLQFCCSLIVLFPLCSLRSFSPSDFEWHYSAPFYICWIQLLQL